MYVSNREDKAKAFLTEKSTA